jgi:tRNA splicing endonuclease
MHISNVTFLQFFAAFKQQNAVRGLPLQLYPEEVTLALEEGWAVLYGPVVNSNDANTDGSTKNKKRKSSGGYHYNDQGNDDDDEFSEDDGYYYQHHGSEDDEEQREAERKKKIAPWQDALAKGTVFEIPTTAEEALHVQHGSGENAAADGDNESKKIMRAEVHWTFPSTVEERDSYLVFKDLHSRGFRITGGSKFGADYLLYPGDCTLYHAQFCVRLVRFTEVILPALMASACRGSFQARKHLLYASIIVKDGEHLEDPSSGGTSGGGVENILKMLKGFVGKYEIQYMTFGPVDGFGKD